MSCNSALNNNNTIIVTLLLFLTVAFLFVLPFGNILLMYLFRFPALFLILCLVLQNYKFAPQKYTIPLLIIGILCIINIFRFQSVITHELLLSILSAFALLLLIIISPTIHLGRKFKRNLYILSIISIGVLTFHAFSPYGRLGYDWQGAKYESPYLTFGYDNSNFAGIIAFLVFSCLFISAPYKNLKDKLFTLSLSGWTLYMIYETNCRSALFAACIIPFASFFMRRFKLRTWMVYAICLLPFFFVPFYINFAEEADKNVQIMGKSVVSGRQVVYRNYLDEFKDPLDEMIGTFASHPFDNAHNAPLSLYLSLGAIGCLAYFFIMIDRVRRDNKAAGSFTSLAAVYSILAVFVESCGESSMFLGGFPGITFFFIIYIFASFSGKTTDSWG